MSDMVVANNSPTPDFPYTVTMVFPGELVNEEIFKNNLSHIYDDLKELVEETDLLKRHQKLLENLKFDSQKKKQLEIIQKIEKRISEIDDRMSNEISPYVWGVFKNFDNYMHECKAYIKADYLMILRRVDYEQRNYEKI